MGRVHAKPPPKKTRAPKVANPMFTKPKRTIMTRSATSAQKTTIANKAGYGTGNAGKNFVGMLRGKKIILPNVEVRKIQYKKRQADKLKELRAEFNSTVRKKFIKSLAEKVTPLKNAGISDEDIKKMKDGLVPKGYQVHHKIPLDGGGTNDFSNLVLIKNDPYHIVITNTQNSATSHLKAGDSETIEKWPVPEGKIYPQQ